MSKTAIRFGDSASDYRAFFELIREYTDWCRARYVEDSWFVAAAFGHQSLESDLGALPAAYGPPNGKTLLAVSDGRSAAPVPFVACRPMPVK